MLKPKTSPVRHREAAPRGRTTVNIDLGGSLAHRSATRAPVRDAAASFVASAKTLRRDLAAIGEQQAAIRDGLARLAPVVEAHKAARDAEARYASQAERCSPAAVNAANRARWSRP